MSGSSIGDFLFNGSAPPSTSTYGSSVQNIPTWLSDYTQGLVSRANAVGAAGYQPYVDAEGNPIQRVAGLTKDSGSAFDMVRQNAGAYAPAIDSAISRAAAVPGAAGSWFGSANANLGAATQTTRDAMSPAMGGLAQAMPWARGAGQTFTGQNANAYMNPYVDNVINRSAALATRNFNENILPGLNDQFVGAGQFGSGRHQEIANRAARDLTQNIQDTANQQLAGAYESGQQAFNADAGRFAGMAGTMGGLGTQQQQNMLAAGNQLGQIGAQYGTTGNQMGQLGLSAAERQGQLAQTGQQMGIADAAQLNAIGTQQQQQNQQNLDTAYGDWTQQRDYDRNTLDWMSQIIRGMPASSSTSGTSTGPASTYQPSMMSQLTSLATGLTGLSKLSGSGSNTANGNARGGLIRNFARGGLSYAPGPARLLGPLSGATR